MISNENSFKNPKWKSIIVHDDENIKGFFGPYRWLSNMWDCRIEYEGLIYPSSENAYQASKLVKEDRIHLTRCSSYDAKSIWKNFRLLDSNNSDWERRRYRNMVRISLVKYNNNLDLRERLISTNNKYLEETNWWGDYFWGKDKKGVGENNFGKILMDIREFFIHR